MDEIRYTPIGIVRSPFLPEDHPPSRRVESKGTVSTIVVFPEYIEGLRDIGGFSHIILLCHLHLTEECALTVKPPSDTVTHGVFATRSPRRPNPISMTVVRLQEVDGNFLHVADLDLLDGTPVLDIKPYVETVGKREEVRTGWMQSRDQR